MLVLVLLMALVLVALVVAASIVAMLRDGHGAIAEHAAYDTRRPRL